MVDRIGHYRIVAELGRGGMGVVYKAHEQSLNRFVALKVLGEHLTDDDGYIERFLREAQSAAALNHPNIVQVYQVGEDDGKHYFAMEFVTGRSLQQILRNSGPLDPVQVARIALQTAAGLQAAHEQNIVHRDIKPANLLIDERGLVKIADFGLALMAGAASRLTATGMFMGTPGYLSPEQCLDQNVDHRTDIYSLGVTLYEALSGKVPFTADSPLALLRQIVEVEPPDLGDFAPEVDSDLRTLITRMMAKDRDLRIASCGELVGGLETYLESHGGAGTLAVRLASAGASSSPATDGEEIESQPTHVLSGDQDDVFDASPPPPPPATAPATGPTHPPIVETSPLAEPQGGGQGRLALVAVLVVALGLAAIVAGGIFAWRSGLFASAKSDSAPEAAVETDQGRPATDPEVDMGQESSDQDLSSPQEEGESAAVAGITPSKTTAEGVAALSQEIPPPAPPGSTGSTKKAEPERRAEGNIHRPKQDTSRNEVVAPPPRQPPPTGTVVVAVGEELFSREAETVMEATLARYGLEVVDEYSVPGAAGIISGAADRDPGELNRLLRPYARNAVVIRVEYLGERELVYMGRRDVAFQSRVTVVPIDLWERTPLESPSRFKVEYTHLNAERVAEEKMRSESRRVAELLSSR